MPQSYKQCVWKGYLNAGTDVRTPAEFNELFGRADDLSFQLNLENIENAATINVEYFVSNDGGKYFVSLATPVSWTPTGPASQKVGSVSGVNGDQGYAKINIPSGTMSAYGELWVCGRTS